MKRVLLALAIVTGLLANAQYEQGQSDINLGFGFLSLGIDGEGSFPLGVSYDYMIKDDISLGLGFNYLTSEFKYLGVPVYDITYMNFGIRGLYHFDILDPLDTYGGVVLGYTSGSIDYADETAAALFGGITASTVYYGLVGGIRYRFLNDQFGLFLEAGYAISPLTFGLNASF